jgi:hypothetical protein
VKAELGIADEFGDQNSGNVAVSSRAASAPLRRVLIRSSVISVIFASSETPEDAARKIQLTCLVSGVLLNS